MTIALGCAVGRTLDGSEEIVGFSTRKLNATVGIAGETLAQYLAIGTGGLGTLLAMYYRGTRKGWDERSEESTEKMPIPVDKTSRPE